jgi:signal transduction histidine kinase
MRKLRLSLKTTILIYFIELMVIVVLFTCLALLVMVDRGLRDQRYHFAQITSEAIKSSLGAIASLPSDEEAKRQYISFIERVKTSYDTRKFIVVDERFGLIGFFSTDLPTPQESTYRDENLAQAVLNGRKIIEYVRDSTNPVLYNRVMKITAPFFREGRVVGAYELDVLVPGMAEMLGQYRGRIILLLIVYAFLLAITGSLLLSRNVVRPIRRLVQATEKLAEGDYESQIEEFEENELGVLANSFNVMSSALKMRREELRHRNKELEEANLRLKETQDELVRSEKLASTGILAAGVAHEIGNPISAIQGYSEILLRSERSKEEAGDLISRIQKEINRIDNIIKGLLSFSRPQKLDIRRTSAIDIFDQAIEFIEQQGRFNEIKVEKDFESDTKTVFVDSTSLQQVLLNLMLNSIDAIKRKEDIVAPLLTLSLKCEKLGVEPADMLTDSDKMFPTSSILTDMKSLSKGDPVVEFTVKDNGCGMSEDERLKVFDPFYTTKEPGGGTGLGLSISLRTIRSFGGIITVESEPGVGSSFSVVLPEATA